MMNLKSYYQWAAVHKGVWEIGIHLNLRRWVLGVEASVESDVCGLYVELGCGPLVAFVWKWVLHGS